MKTWVRISIIIIPPLVVLFYLIFSNDVFSVLNVVKGEAKSINITLPPETVNMEVHFDAINALESEGKSVLQIKGWAFRKKVSTEKRKLYFVLISSEGNKVFEVEKCNLPRPDVTEFFKLTKGINNHGFELILPVYKLKDNLYKVGIIIEDENDKNFTFTNRGLKISDGHPAIIKVESGQVSQKITDALQQPTKEGKASIDKVEITDKILSVVGWGFLQGMDPVSQKTNVILKKDGQELLFSVFIRERKDVTKVFGKNGINLDSTGFMARIPVGSLQPGTYQFGLYITNNDQKGVIYFKKSVEIIK